MRKNFLIIGLALIGQSINQIITIGKINLTIINDFTRFRNYFVSLYWTLIVLFLGFIMIIFCFSKKNKIKAKSYKPTIILFFIALLLYISKGQSVNLDVIVDYHYFYPFLMHLFLSLLFAYSGFIYTLKINN